MQKNADIKVFVVCVESQPVVKLGEGAADHHAIVRCNLPIRYAVRPADVAILHVTGLWFHERGRPIVNFALVLVNAVKNVHKIGVVRQAFLRYRAVAVVHFTGTELHNLVFVGFKISLDLVAKILDPALVAQ
ncbi:hypothetical protein D3C87_1629440 [compost metagenome]